MSFANANTGWVVGDGGTILKSTNTGVNWSPQTSGKTITLTSVDFLDANNGVVCGGKGFAGIVLRTTNGGQTWTSVDTSSNLSSIDYVTATVAWAVGAGGIIKSVNGGATWSKQPLPDSSTYYNSIKFFDADTGWLTGLSPSSGVLYRTTNGGSTWMPETAGIHYYDYIDAIYFLDSQNGWMSGYTVPDTIGYGMIKRTTNGGRSWINSPLGTDQELYSIAFASLNEGWACGTSGILLHSTDGGVNWFDDGTGTTSLDKITVRPGEGGWIVGLNGTILRNNFGGLSQQITTSMRAGWNMICLPMNVPDRRKTTLYPTATSSAFRYASVQGYVADDTLDVGTGYWVKFSSPLDITYDGSLVDSISLNLLAGWNLVGGISTDVRVSSIVQSPPNSIAYVYGYSSTGYHADTTLKAGEAYWIKVSQNSTLTIKSTPPGMSSGIIFTDISKFKNDELPPPPPSEAAAEEAASTEPLPTDYRLGQNYPNPFNPTTNIQIDLPEPSNVVVAVYNTLGQEVARLLEGTYGAGSTSVLWDARGKNGEVVGSGIYFYRMIATSATSDRHYEVLKKMILMK